MFNGSATPSNNGGGIDLVNQSTATGYQNDPMVNVPLSYLNNKGNEQQSNDSEPRFSTGTLLVLLGTAFTAAVIVVGTYYNFKSDIKDINHELDNRTKDIKHKVNNIEINLSNFDLKGFEKEIMNIRSNISQLNKNLSEYDIKKINEKLDFINKDLKEIKIKIEFNRENILSNKKDINSFK